MHETRLSIFANYIIHLSQANSLPLKDHPQLQLMVDILSRQQHHHILLTNCMEKKIRLAITASLQQHFAISSMPKTLQNAHFIYFDITRFELATEEPEEIERDFHTLCTEAQAKNQQIIFIIDQIEPLLSEDYKTPQGYLGKLFKFILAEPQWRLIIITPNEPKLLSPYFTEFFTYISFIAPTKNQKIALLKSLRTELEEFHQVTLLDEIFSAALDMANDYLPDGSSLDSALELLDSAAARASAAVLNNATEHKPIVTQTHLTLILASWTRIPLAHLQNPHFQVAKFIEAMQQRIFGHDTAIQAIGSLLQTASLKLRSKPGPHCSFLFAGPACVGKAALAEAMADYLFGHKNALLHINFTSLPCTLHQLKVTIENRCLDLLTAVAQKPYAILLLENIDQYAPELIENFKTIFAYGYILNSENKKVDFHNTIIIMTTTVGADCIIKLTSAAPEKNKTLDLLQLVLNESLRDITHHSLHQFSLSELRDEMISTLAAHFSSDFLQYTHTIPFISLDYISLEKIMHAKIKTLTKHLLTHFSIELTYTPEVIKFLAQEALWQRSNIKSLDSWLEQQLYACITHEILMQTERKRQSNQLLVQLNENRQSLCCEFIISSETTLYNL